MDQLTFSKLTPELVNILISMSFMCGVITSIVLSSLTDIVCKFFSFIYKRFRIYRRLKHIKNNTKMIPKKY